MNDKDRIVDRTGSAEEALLAMWKVVDELVKIAQRLDPLVDELAQVPGDANRLLKKLFDYLEGLNLVTTDTVTQVTALGEVIDAIKAEQAAQAEQLDRIEKLLREIHAPLTNHIR